MQRSNLAFRPLAPASRVAALALFLVAPASSQCGLEQILPQAGFEDTIAWGVSDDGTTVVGASYFSFSGPNERAFSWSAATGLVPLPSPGLDGSEAFAVSADGSVVVGCASPGPVAWIGGGSPLTLLPATGLYAGGEAQDVSAGGSTIVGWTRRSVSNAIVAFRWTAASGFVELTAPSGFTRAFAEGVSGDGSVVVGRMQTSVISPSRAFRWTEAGGFVDITPPGAVSALALAASADGSVIVGQAAFSGSVRHAVRWDATGTATSLGAAPGTDSSARAVTSDGRSVVGEANGSFDFMAWSVETGPVDHAAWIPEGGLFNDVSDNGVHVGLTYYGPFGESYAIVWRGSEVGATYCDTAVPNSTGCIGRLSAEGSADVAASNLSLRASSLPQNVFGLFLAARATGSTLRPGGSTGTLCLSGPIGRFSGPGQSSGAAGELRLALDLTALPTPNAPSAALPGETWYFQTWYRDSDAGVATSNFTDAVSVTFR